MRLQIYFSLAILLISGKIQAQGCCSGGSGSPIAGGTSQGVLSERQMELNANFQYLNTSKFYAQDRDTAPLFDNLNSKYLYFRLAYGVTKSLTMSVESGYFLNKTQIGLHKKDTITSQGIGDLILFPRYTIYTNNTETRRTEATLGLGFKIPLGTYNDSIIAYYNPKTQKTLYSTAPSSVQPTTGSNDFIFYGFLYQGFPEIKFRIFMNALYVRKGWTPLGVKFGDYASIGLFAGRTFFNRLGITLQVKGEWMGIIKSNLTPSQTIVKYNVDVLSSGGRKVLIVPQLSYTYKTFTIYALTEYPLYQYVNRAQVGSEYLATAGLTYRFMIKKREAKAEDSSIKG